MRFATLTAIELEVVHLTWLDAYEHAFRPGPRVRIGPRAEHALRQEHPGTWYVFSAPCRVPGTRAYQMGYPLPDGYRCEGPTISLWPFREQEPVVLPADLSWSMLYVDPDPMQDGPYFVRREWLVPPRALPNPRNGPRRRPRP